MRIIHSSLRTFACVVSAAIVFAACGGGGHSSSPVPATPTPRASPSPTAGPTDSASPSATDNPQAFNCPSSDTSFTSASARTSAAAAERSTAFAGLRRVAPLRRNASAARQTASATSGNQLIAVTYDINTATTQRSALALRESNLGATLTREFAFSHANLDTRVLSVPAAKVAAVEAAFRSRPGVQSVGLTGQRRYRLAVTAPYFTNDPYFTGFSSTADGSTPTFEALPLAESATVPGQWDMHAIRLEYAFAYSQANNGSGLTDSGALGSSAVKIAMIDTGQDTTHPELASKIAYQRCFITNESNVQSTSDFTTDEDGHGTNTAGIAGAAIGNSLGFVGAGGNIDLYAYRVFPTPNDNCTDPNSTDAQCGTTTLDIAAAINDAIAQHVNVISMSLGDGSCTNGVDSDSTEGAAVANAIKANIVVVAAAGNSTGPPVNAPACDTGVIAVGATSLADGQTNGSNKSGGSAASPFEYVASYTDSGTPGAAVNSSSAWGIVAPGGDPNGDTDSDYLHWITHIWTSTPFDANYQGSCTGDYPNNSGTVDCQTLIAGTSMATPHVAGAAALIISATGTQYQNPTLMKQLLCSTADDISDANEGCGRLDVYRAMATAIGDPAPPGPSPVP